MNTDRLRELAQWLADNPDSHDQSQWSTCLAGWAAVKYCQVAPEDIDDRGMAGNAYVAQLAREALGIGHMLSTWLFDADCTLGDIWAVVRISAGEGEDIPLENSLWGNKGWEMWNKVLSRVS